MVAEHGQPPLLDANGEQIIYQDVMMDDGQEGAIPLDQYQQEVYGTYEQPENENLVPADPNLVLPYASLDQVIPDEQQHTFYE